MMTGVPVCRWRWHRFKVDRLGSYGAFPSTAKRRIVFLTDDRRIPRSQVFPFFCYRDEVRSRWEASILEVPLSVFRQNPARFGARVDAVCFQTGFDLTPDQMERLVASVRWAYPDARLAYLDWFAPTDLRYAETLSPHLEVYLKKNVLRNRSQYGRPTVGDTPLTDFYGRKFAIDHPQRCWKVPGEFFGKLNVGPGFFFTPELAAYYLGAEPGAGGRDIDMHARLGTKGSDWYTAMRREAVMRVDDLNGMKVVTGAGISPRRYLRELGRSKLCFSPFGYGEVCWRDYEAVAMGCLLVKPDTSHVETRPDIFVNDETYAPVRWDLSDLEEVCRRYLQDDQLRRKVTSNAFTRLSEYFRRDRFLEQMDPFFRALLG